MSERLYAWLLRLFPKDFRESYGREALKLVCDRSRDEHGLLLRLRLWSDLLADLMISVPREHYRARRTLNDECSSQEALASPSFQLLAVNRIRPAFLLFGSVLTLVAQNGLLTLSSATNASSSVLSIGSRPTGIVALPARPDPGGTSTENSRGAWLRTYLGEDLFAKEASSTPSEGPAFATISITPSRSTDPRNERMRVLPNGDLTAQAVSLASLLSFAYDVPANPSPRLSGLPGWSLERYDIEAKAAPGAFPSGVSSIEALHQAQQMMRELLAKRFALDFDVEEKKMPVYALSVASGGPKLQQSPVAQEPCVFDTDPAGCHTFVIGFGHPLRARAVDMDDLAHYIENWTDLPVINRTGLRKLFTLNTGGWRPMRLPPPPPGATPNPSVFATLPTVFTVLADLGLTLDKKDATVPVYTIERIEQPANN